MPSVVNFGTTVKGSQLLVSGAGPYFNGYVCLYAGSAFSPVKRGYISLEYFNGVYRFHAGGNSLWGQGLFFELPSIFDVGLSGGGGALGQIVAHWRVAGLAWEAALY